MSNTRKRKVMRVDLPDGEAGYVRVMSGRDLARFKQVMQAAEADPHRDVIAVETLVALTACDADGNRAVPPAEEAAVAEWPYTDLMSYFKAAAELNGIAEKKSDAEALPAPPPACDDEGNRFVVSSFNGGGTERPRRKQD